MLSRKLLISASRQEGRSNRLLGSIVNLNYPFGWSKLERDDHGSSYIQKKQQQRSFHATPRQEILPVLAVGAVLLIGRYSWKAFNRMDEEWEDYQWQLQQYERQRVKEKVGDIPTTIGVDLGTLYLKLSTLNGNKAELVTTAQGDRYRFTGILMNDGDEIVTGTPALDKFFYQPTGGNLKEPVVLPYRELQKASHDEAATMVQQVFVPAVGEAMERLSSGSANKNGGVRTVLTLPPTFYNQHGETIFQNYHDEAHHTVTVPDSVAAIWGAQVLDLIPTPQSKEENTASTLVVDVGGLATSISLVKQDKVVASSTLDGVGGESFVQQLAYRVLEEAGDDTLSNDAMTLALVETSARASVLELVNKTQAKVHIPFLFMGRKPDTPHLDTNISRSVLEQTVQDFWASSVVPKLLEDGELSASLPPPTNGSTLITSAVTKVLEEAEETPNNIKHILLVGGGSRHKLFEQACQEGIQALMGPSPQKLVVPEGPLRAELTVIGAASLLPNFDYSYDKGLERVE